MGVTQSFRDVLSTIDADMQAQAATMLSAYVDGYQAPINGAILIAKRGSGTVRAYVGSSGYQDRSRKGAVNYLTAKRSPGSTLKLLIYAEALHRRVISVDQVFDDRPILIDVLISCVNPGPSPKGQGPST